MQIDCLSNRLKRIAFVLVLLGLSGCSDSNFETYPVHGIIRFPDGKVLREGSIEFEATDRSQPITATGTIKPDGTFSLGTHAIDDGALAGKHRVAVIADHVIGTGAERPGLIPEPTLHPKYRDFDRSDIVLEVRKQTNHFIVEVEYAEGQNDPSGLE